MEQEEQEKPVEYIYDKQKRNESWINHKGESVPYEYVRPWELYAEEKIGRSYDKLVKLSELIKDTKEFVSKVMQDYWNKYGKADDENVGGTFTITNFRKTLKLKREVALTFEYDQDIIEECEEHFRNFLASFDSIGLEGEQAKFFRKLKDSYSNAFTKRGDKYDVNRLERLSKERQEWDNPDFIAMLDGLNRAKQVTGKSVYYYLYLKTGKGSNDWEKLDLNWATMGIEDPYLKSEEVGDASGQPEE